MQIHFLGMEDSDLFEQERHYLEGQRKDVYVVERGGINKVSLSLFANPNRMKDQAGQTQHPA